MVRLQIRTQVRHHAAEWKDECLDAQPSMIDRAFAGSSLEDAMHAMT